MVSSERTPVSLLARLRDSADGEAWREFDERYRELILRHCRRRGLQTADAEDVRQVVMLSLSKALHSFRYDPALGRFRDYLGRTVNHAVLRAMSRPDHGRWLLEPEELGNLAAASGSEPDEAWESDWMQHHMRLAMEVVSRSCEAGSVEVLERFLAGESVAAISEAVGKSMDAVYKILQRMRDRLQEQVARQVAEEEP